MARTHTLMLALVPAVTAHGHAGGAHAIATEAGQFWLQLDWML